MEELFSTAQASSKIGCVKSTVIKCANRLKVGRLIGRSLVFTADEVEAIRGVARDGPGCPLFVAGNQLSPYSQRKAAAKKTAKKKGTKKTKK